MIQHARCGWGRLITLELFIFKLYASTHRWLSEHDGCQLKHGAQQCWLALLASRITSGRLCVYDVGVTLRVMCERRHRHTHEYVAAIISWREAAGLPPYTRFAWGCSNRPRIPLGVLALCRCIRARKIRAASQLWFPLALTHALHIKKRGCSPASLSQGCPCSSVCLHTSMLLVAALWRFEPRLPCLWQPAERCLCMRLAWQRCLHRSCAMSVACLSCLSTAAKLQRRAVLTCEKVQAMRRAGMT